MFTILGALVSRNSLAIAACAGLIAWAHLGIKKHDRTVARAAVAEHTEKARDVVKKAKVAQRRVDPAGAGGVLDRRYCTDCPGQ